LKELLPESAPFRRCPVQTGDDRLLGGLDLATSLAMGQPVVQRGLLSEVDGGVLVLPMAERLSSATAARIAAALDEGPITQVVMATGTLQPVIQVTVGTQVSGTVLLRLAPAALEAR
jgi:hypothetical protein